MVAGYIMAIYLGGSVTQAFSYEGEGLLFFVWFLPGLLWWCDLEAALGKATTLTAPSQLADLDEAIRFQQVTLSVDRQKIRLPTTTHAALETALQLP